MVSIEYGELVLCIVASIVYNECAYGGYLFMKCFSIRMSIFEFITRRVVALLAYGG